MTPIPCDITDLSVIADVAPVDRRGSTNVWVMLQAYELHRVERFLHEAQSAIDAAQGMRFSFNDQASVTAWGAAACRRR